MRSRPNLPAVFLCLLLASAAHAQGFGQSPGQVPGQGPGQGMGQMPGSPFPGGGMPVQGPFGPANPGYGSQPGMTNPGGPGQGGQPGFGAQPGFGQPTMPAQPARQNYADELTDFNVPPQSEMQPNVGSETPTSIPGGHLITTAEMRQTLGQTGIVIIDVLEGPPHPQIPGSLWMPGAGRAGSFNDGIQQQLWTALSQVTQMQPDRPIAFLCAGSRCWESYNAALRAQRMGFKMVLWYRGGLASWQAAGLPMTNPGQAGGPPQQQQGSPGFSR